MNISMRKKSTLKKKFWSLHPWRQPETTLNWTIIYSILFLKKKHYNQISTYDPSGLTSTWPKNLTGNTTSCLTISQGLNFCANPVKGRRTKASTTFYKIYNIYHSSVKRNQTNLQPVLSNFFLALFGDPLLEQPISVPQTISPCWQIQRCHRV